MTQPENSKNFTVLYVEDESFIRTNVEGCLKYFFNVIVAKDGQDGLNIFSNEKIDLIITDINMPNKNGLEMLNDIKLINPSIPCIVTSAYDIDIINKTKNLGVCRYITKPFDIKDLLNDSLKILKENV
ncbi:response regulator [Arcobacter arenosus]|uniref:Response regulator n=1 Tax=Arcobacter arenosus TaxID=2576037 RepID=A0A5R8XXT9_9BACT|nr:response regulator [Arcobacter arenosus]TLP35778.1 response regulator [Arcobacter arenosus]